MSGLLAWAADVVGGVQDGDDEEGNLVPVIFTPEQQRYAVELDAKAASLTRSIQDLRLRIPPADISQRLPHLHAHSIASNVDLALQLNAHSTTRQQIREREVALQDENGAYEKAISNCQKGIQDKLQEADLLQKKLMEMDIIERDLRLVIERKQIEEKTWQSNESSNETRGNEDAYRDGEPLRNDLAEDLNRKRKELSSMEELVQKLEEQWKQIQHDSLKQPSPAQREKILDRQLHSLIEQLSVKQAQAEGLAGEIRTKQLEIEQVNAMKRKVENDFVEGGIARNRRKNRESRENVVEICIRDVHINPSIYWFSSRSPSKRMGYGLCKLLGTLKSKLREILVERVYHKIEKSESMRIEMRSRRAQKLIAETLKLADSPGRKSYGF